MSMGASHLNRHYYMNSTRSLENEGRVSCKTLLSIYNYNHCCIFFPFSIIYLQFFKPCLPGFPGIPKSFENISKIVIAWLTWKHSEFRKLNILNLPRILSLHTTTHFRAKCWGFNWSLWYLADHQSCPLLTWTETRTGTFYFNLDSWRRDGNSPLITTILFFKTLKITS